MVKDINIDDFNYILPDDRIAGHPLEKRDECKLLLSRPDGKISHQKFSQLPSLLPPGSFLVCNDTKVINARLMFHKDSGARIEIFLLKPLEPSDYVLMFQAKKRCVWKCLVGNLKKWKEGTLSLALQIENSAEPIILQAKRLSDNEEGEGVTIEFTWDNPDVTFSDIIELAGKIPIPPYLNRDTEQSDSTDYQTVYADSLGSVAAPTAGLHFTDNVFKDLEAHNIPVGKLTLHVGAGTFKPVKSKVIGDHDMHHETFTISLDLLNKLIDIKEKGRPLVAVGTTSVRSLESIPLLGQRILEGKDPYHITQWEAYQTDNEIPTLKLLKYLKDYMEANTMEEFTASTAIMIAPGYKWRMTDVMVTNFHQPKSTLLLLVSSFLGDNPEGGKDDNNYEKNVSTLNTPQWKRVYDEALIKDYRFLSYGDACLLFKKLPILR